MLGGNFTTERVVQSYLQRSAHLFMLEALHKIIEKITDELI